MSLHVAVELLWHSRLSSNSNYGWQIYVKKQQFASWPTAMYPLCPSTYWYMDQLMLANWQVTIFL